MASNFILIIVLVLGVLLLVAPLALLGFALFQGWFTLPHPEPDRERK